MSKLNLMSEYDNITKELENIRNQIISLKDLTETKMKSAKSEDERSSIFIDFKSKIDKIQQDKNTKKKYIKTKQNKK